MGCYRKCSCSSGCHICEDNYANRSNFSFSFAGFDVSDTLPPLPDGVTPEETTGRSLFRCQEKPLLEILRNYVELPWTDPEVVLADNVICGGVINHFGECQYLCNSCECATVYDIKSPCSPITNKHHERSYKSATVWKVWSKESISYELIVECCDTIGDEIRYRLNVTYYEVRLGAQNSKTIQRFRPFSVYCEYSAGDPFADPVITYGDWFYPPEFGGGVLDLEDPCLPCVFPSYTASYCTPLVLDCPTSSEMPEFDYYWLPVEVHCGLLNQVCGDLYLNDPDCKATKTEGLAYVGNYQTTEVVQTCSDVVDKVCLDQINVGVRSVLASASYESDCIPCGEVGSTIELSRISSSHPLDENDEVVLRNAVNGIECSLPQLKIALPSRLVLNFS